MNLKNLTIENSSAGGYVIKHKRTGLYMTPNGFIHNPSFVFREISLFDRDSNTFVATSPNGHKHLIFDRNPKNNSEGYITKHGYKNISQDYDCKYRIVTLERGDGQSCYFYYDYFKNDTFEKISIADINVNPAPIYPKILGYWVLDNLRYPGKKTISWYMSVNNEKKAMKVMDYIAVDDFSCPDNNLNIFLGHVHRNGHTQFRVFLRKKENGENICPELLDEWFVSFQLLDDSKYFKGITPEGFCRVISYDTNKSTLCYWPLTEHSRYADCFIYQNLLFAKKENGLFDIINKNGDIISILWEVRFTENSDILRIKHRFSGEERLIKYDDIENVFSNISMTVSNLKPKNEESPITNHVITDNMLYDDESFHIDYIRILTERVDKTNLRLWVKRARASKGLKKSDTVCFIYPKAKKMFIVSNSKPSQSTFIFDIIYSTDIDEQLYLNIKDVSKGYITFDKECRTPSLQREILSFLNNLYGENKQMEHAITAPQLSKTDILNKYTVDEQIIYLIFEILSKYDFEQEDIFRAIHALLTALNGNKSYEYNDHNLPWNDILNECSEKEIFDIMSGYIKYLVLEHKKPINALNTICMQTKRINVQTICDNIEKAENRNSAQIKHIIETISNELKNNQ